MMTERTDHILDRPILNALRTRHAGLAEGGHLALRYRTDVSPFATVVEDSGEALNSLASLIPPNGMVIVVQREKQEPPPGMVVAHVSQAVQMIAASVAAPVDGLSFTALGDDDAAEMLGLANLTKPGPYVSRTHDFGGYIGIRVDGRLAAMAGHRLKVPGFTEVSAVCTHPDFRGKGYASLLMRVVAARITADGDTPFLHTYTTNTEAIRLYERLGFVHRTNLWVSVLRHA